MSISLIPTTMEELGEALSQLTEKSLVLAGGTDLVLVMRAKLLEPDIVLCLTDVPQLREIQITPERVVIGTMVTMHDLELATNGIPDLQALADASSDVGSPQVRNKATVGGNVANASPAADTPSVLWALGAQVDIMGPGGVRRLMPICEFMLGSKKTALNPGEIIVGFIIDRTALRGWRSAYHKLGHRTRVTISRIGMTIVVREDENGIVQDARVVAGAIKPIPFELKAAEDILRGQRADPSLAEAIGATFKGNTRRVYKENAAKGVAEDVLLLLKNR